MSEHASTNGEAIDFLLSRVNGRMRIIPFSEILFVRAQKNHIEIVTPQSKIVAHTSLHKVEEKLPEELFLKVHRSCIVCIKKIKEFDHNAVYIEEHTLPLSSKLHEKLFQKFMAGYIEEERHKTVVVKMDKELKGKKNKKTG